MILITQHCFAGYRLPIFHELMAGKVGPKAKLAFGNNPKSSSVKTFESIHEIPVDTRIDQAQYRILNNIWIGKILWQKGLLKEVAAPDIDAVIFEGNAYHLSTWLALVMLFFSRKKVGIWSHGSKKPLSGIKKVILRFFWGMSDFLLIYGQQGFNCLTSAGVPKSKIYPIHNSLNYFKQKKIREELDQNDILHFKKSLFKSPELPLFLWVGRLIPARRLDMLIAVAKRMHDENNPVNVLIVGPDDNGTLSKLKKMAYDFHISSSVNFYGPSYDETQNAKFFMMATALVSPGPIGLTCIHALTYGTPVITNDNKYIQNPEIDAILPGVTGEFFSYNNFDSLVNSIKKILRWPIQHEERIRVCDQIILKYFSTEYQCQVISSALSGENNFDWNWRDSFEKIF
jgi:glycosyltransferase involved in cell wall biosynthesis